MREDPRHTELRRHPPLPESSRATGPWARSEVRAGRGRAIGDGARRGSRWLFFLLVGLLGVVGVAAGTFVGLPGAVERYALDTLSRLERRYGVRIEAESVDWEWGGAVRARGVEIRAADGPRIATLPEVDLALDVAWWSRRASLASLRVSRPVVELTRSPDGRTNLDAVLAALKSAPIGGGAAPSRLTLSGAKVAVDGLEVVIAPSAKSLPFELEIPDRVELRRGRVAIDGASGTVTVSFADTSLDPGQSLSLELGFAEDGWLSPPLGSLGRLDRVAVSAARPVRFWLGERVVGLGGLALTRDGVELFPLQLSVPVPGRAATSEVHAAATVERLVIGVPGLAALDTPGALMTFARSLRAALDADTSEAPPLTRISLARPALSLVLSEGHHSFEDLIGMLGAPKRATGAAAAKVALPPEDEQLLVNASLAAVRRSHDRPAPSAVATGRKSSAPMARALAEPLAQAAASLATRFDALDAALTTASRVGRVTRELSIDGGELSLELEGVPLTLSAGSVRIGTDESGAVKVAASADNPLAPAHRVELALSRSATGMVSVAFSARHVPLAGLQPLAKKLHFGSEGELDTLTLEGRLSRDRVELDFVLALSRASWSHPSVASQSLSPLDGAVRGRLTFDVPSETLSLSDLAFTSGDVSIEGALDLASALSAPRLKLALTLPDTPLQAIIAAIPQGLVPLLAGLRMEGRLGWRLVVDLDTTQPAAIRIDSQPHPVAVRVMTLGERLDFAALRTAHTYTIRLFDGTPGTRVVGPATASWVPLSLITPYLPLALTTTEDGTFYSNDGLSTFAMKESIATNLERQSFVRGASTITQQLVKNLYLGGDKTVSRKLQEVFIAWQLAQTLTKDEVMALYLNTIEFGPGLYGIGDAAWHWFGKRPIDLTLPEAVFLASIVPGPRRYYAFFEQGGITPRWKSYLESLLRVMVERKKITADELAAVQPIEIRLRGHGGGYTDEVPIDFDALPERDDFEPDAPPHE